MVGLLLRCVDACKAEQKIDTDPIWPKGIELLEKVRRDIGWRLS
jgi:hypothetical protein